MRAFQATPTVIARPRAAALLILLVSFLAGCHPPRPSDPLGRAAFDGDVGRLSALLAGSAGQHDAFGALVWAARGGQVGAAAALLDSGVDPNRHDGRNGWTPLMHALHKHQVAVARLLLDRGADPRIGTGRNSPVEMAALDDEAGLVQRMLTAGLPRDQRERALDIAVRGGALVDVDRPLFGTCKTRTVQTLVASDPTLTAGTPDQGFLSSMWWAHRQGCDGTLAIMAAHPAQRRR